MQLTWTFLTWAADVKIFKEIVKFLESGPPWCLNQYGWLSLQRQFLFLSGVRIKNLWTDIFVCLFCFIECFILIACVKIRPHSQCKAATTTQSDSCQCFSVDLLWCKNLKQNKAKSAHGGVTYLVFTRVPGESYRRRLRSLLFSALSLHNLTAVGSVSWPLDSGQKL